MHPEHLLVDFDFISFLLMVIFLTSGVSYFTGIFLSLFYFTTGETDKLNRSKIILLFSLVILLLLGFITYLAVAIPALNKPPGG